MHAFSKIQPPHSIIDNVSHNARIELAIADLESQTELNFAATARKYNVQRTTLSRRFKNETNSKKDAISSVSKTLTNLEKDVLVRYINNLDIRKLPSISQIMKISLRRSQIKILILIGLSDFFNARKKY
jgi:hypothetical protein